MSRTVYLISIILPALWVMATGSAKGADNDSGPPDQNDRWVPSIGLSLGFSTQIHDGSVSSPTPSSVDPLRDFDQNRKSLTGIHVGGSFELQTPSLPIPFVHPRIFIGGEVVHVSSQRRSIAKEGRPFTMISTPDQDAFPTQAITGVGSETTSDLDTRQFGATLGLSFPVKIGDWNISIKPSARYLKQRFRFRGLVTDGARLSISDDTSPIRIVILQGKAEQDSHAIGPALEFEIEAGGVRSLAASVFISGGAYYVLSDRTVEFSTTGRDNLDTIDVTANWNARVEPWIYRANIGFRIRWLGMPGGWLGGALGDGH